MRQKISWTDGRTKGRTEGRTEGQTDRGKTVYPPPLGSGGIKREVENTKGVMIGSYKSKKINVVLLVLSVYQPYVLFIVK